MPEEPEPLSFWRELIREFQPEASDADVNHILAEHTTWPTSGKKVIEDQIEEYMQGMGFKRITNGK